MPFGPRTSPVDKGATFYACPYCKYTCEKKSELRAHLRDEHDHPSGP